MSSIKNLKTTLLLILISIALSQASYAKPPSELEGDVNFAIKEFERQINGGGDFLAKAKGYLVIPTVIKGGFIIGGEYGEGALRVEGETKHYYSMTSASIGYQAGAQVYSIIIVFSSETSLNNFINSDGWEAGVDGSIAVSNWGASKDITTISYEKPIVAFIYGQKGFMASASIEGTRFARIIPQ